MTEALDQAVSQQRLHDGSKQARKETEAERAQGTLSDAFIVQSTSRT